MTRQFTVNVQNTESPDVDFVLGPWATEDEADRAAERVVARLLRHNIPAVNDPEGRGADVAVWVSTTGHTEDEVIDWFAGELMSDHPHHLPSGHVLDLLPTISVGQDSDLKIDRLGGETSRYTRMRVWLARGDVHDGEPFPCTVYVEGYDADRCSWIDVGHYDGDQPPQGLPGVTAGDIVFGEDTPQ